MNNGERCEYLKSLVPLLKPDEYKMITQEIYDAVCMEGREFNYNISRYEFNIAANHLIRITNGR